MSGVIGARSDFMLRGYNPSNVRRQQKTTTTTAIRKSGSYSNLARPVSRCKCRDQEQRFTQLENQYVRNLQQQVYFLELENSYLKNEQKKTVGIRPKLIGEADTLLEKLRKTRHEQEVAESELRQRDIEVDTVWKEREVVMERLKNVEEGHLRDKKALSEEIVEIRKQLDDCQPELARKEAQLSKTETELQDVLAELRTTKSLSETLKTQLHQKQREESALNNLELERRSEVEQLMGNIKTLETDLVENRSRENLLKEELNKIKMTLREAELHARKEKALGEKVLEENDSLIKENCQLTAQLSHLQLTADQYNDQIPLLRNEHVLSELAETKESENNLRAELFKLRECLKSEEAQVRQLTNQLAEQEQMQNRMQEGRTRFQKELDSLEASTRQLSTENQQLRREKINLGNKIDELSKMIANKESQSQAVKDRLQNVEQRYNKLLRHYEQESVVQDEKSREFEQLAMKVKELSQSLRHSPLPNSSRSPEAYYSEEA